MEEKEFEYISKIKNTVLVKQQEFEQFKTKKMNNSVIESGNKDENKVKSKNIKCVSATKNYK